MSRISMKIGAALKTKGISVTAPNASMQSIGGGGIVIISILLAMLVLAVVFGAWGWNASKGVTMDANGWIALALGTFFSLFVGCGLMALMFFSSRYGYDDQADPFRKKQETE